MLLKEISLQTKKLSALCDFYRGVLALPVVMHSSEKIIITAGQTKLSFEPANQATEPFYHFAFNIPSGKIDEAAQWLHGKAELLWIDEYKSYIAEFTSWNARSVYFFDPAGNIVEFIARDDLRDHPSEPFSAAQIRSISEIGIVFPAEEFDERVKTFMQQFHLQYFSKQPPMKHFRALGDDEGLFIVVPEQRNWYPTNIPGGIFPLSVRFENNNNKYYLQL